MADTHDFAGYYVLKEFRIISLTENLEADLSRLVYQFNIEESLAKGYLSGKAEIYDSVGALYDFPIKGEEILVIEYEDFFKKRHRDEMCIYSVTKIDDTKNASDVLIKYEINFVSIDKYITDAVSLQRGFTLQKHSEIVQTLFDDYYMNGTPKKQLLDVVETEGKHTLVIPNYSPSSAMEFISRRAVTSNFTSDSQLIRFFETRKGFFFSSHGDLNAGFVSGIPNEPAELRYQYSTKASYGGENDGGGNINQIRLMQEILQFDFPDHVNTIREMNDGAYQSRITQLDFINRSYLPEDHDHWDFVPSYSQPDGPGNDVPIHSASFVNQYMKNRREILVLKDYPAVGEEGSRDAYFRENTFYPEAYNKKISNFYHHNVAKTTVKVYGRQDLIPGTVIALDIPKMRYDQLGGSPRRDDEKRSGNYLVEKVNNIFFEDRYYQVLEVSKSGYKK